MSNSHHRSRSSIDRALDLLLADLNEVQLAELLEEANSTVAGNVAVADGIHMFEKQEILKVQRPSSAIGFQRTPSQVQSPLRKFPASLSSRRTVSIRRQQSIRVSSASEPTTTRAQTTAPEVTKTNHHRRAHYRRISRPYFDLPKSVAATPSLPDLLAAYLQESPVARVSPISTDPEPVIQYAEAPALAQQSQIFSPRLPGDSDGWADIVGPGRHTFGRHMDNIGGILERVDS